MLKRAWWLIVLNLLIPGSAQLIAGSKRFGRFALRATATFWVFSLVLLALALINRNWVLTLVTLPMVDFVVAVVLIAYALIFAILSLDTLRLLRIVRLPSKARLITFLAMISVGALGTTAIAYAGNLAGVQANLIGTVFNQGGFTEPINGRYNILLLGADAGRKRLGIRPDSISVLSIDAVTGAVVNIGIPRNMQRVPFAPGSPMQKLWPNGYNCGDVCLINAIYKDVTDSHLDLYPKAEAQGSTAGVEATKEAVEGVTGLTIQSYVMVDMVAFSSLVDALGGVTIDVKQRLPIGGQEDALGQPINVNGWIEPGVQHMNGKTALWYARARHGSSDYARMARQREVEAALLSQLDPANVVSRFQQIANAGKRMIHTDIPSAMLGRYVDLAVKAKKLGIKALQLVPPTYDMVYPNFSAIQLAVKKAVRKAS
jgi:LCP family protein required for cell wall assembly